MRNELPNNVNTSPPERRIAAKKSAKPPKRSGAEVTPPVRPKTGGVRKALRVGAVGLGLLAPGVAAEHEAPQQEQQPKIIIVQKNKKDVPSWTDFQRQMQELQKDTLKEPLENKGPEEADAGVEIHETQEEQREAEAKAYAEKTPAIKKFQKALAEKNPHLAFVPQSSESGKVVGVIKYEGGQADIPIQIVEQAGRWELEANDGPFGAEHPIALSDVGRWSEELSRQQQIREAGDALDSGTLSKEEFDKVAKRNGATKAQLQDFWQDRDNPNFRG